jgi:hypothetical protein
MFIRQDEIRPDDRYYWVTANENGSYTATPKALEDKEEVDQDGNPMFVQVLDKTDPENPVMVNSTQRLITKGLKSNHIAQVKQTANSILAQTDWMVIRKAERNVDIPADTASYRAAVIAKATELEAAISAVTSVEELIAVNLSFPNNGVI